MFIDFRERGMEGGQGGERERERERERKRNIETPM